MEEGDIAPSHPFELVPRVGDIDLGVNPVKHMTSRWQVERGGRGGIATGHIFVTWGIQSKNSDLETMKENALKGGMN